MSGETQTDAGQGNEEVEVPVAWEALEDAFENNAPEVHSYLHFDTGEVIRIVDGVADPAMHSRIMSDGKYLRIDPVSSREQYRWMERFIATVEDSEIRGRLTAAIDGKGAFRRFKDALMHQPLDRERWFVFRSERLRACMEAWLAAHGIRPVTRATWDVPTADEVQVENLGTPVPVESTVVPSAPSSQHQYLLQLADSLSARDLEMAIAFLEFLSTRRSASPKRRAIIEPSKAEGATDVSEA